MASSLSLETFFEPYEITLCSHFFKEVTKESQVFFLAYFLAAYRLGYPSCALDGELDPKPSDLFTVQDPLFENLILKGRSEMISSPYLIKKEGRLYLQKTAALVKAIEESLGEKLAVCSSFREEKEHQVKVERINKLTSEQNEALFLALSAPFFSLTGGPGTGKTHTASIFLEAYFAKEGFDKRVFIAAPTGKASFHLFTKIANEKPKGALSFGTLHAYLKEVESKLYDLVIVDECSMIDLEMMKEFIVKTPLFTKVLLLGDPNQLPPVGIGSIFQEVDRALPSSHKRLLTKCLRTDVQDIHRLSLALLESSAEDAYECAKDFIEEWGGINEASIDEMFAFLPKDGSIDTCFEAFSSFAILTPLRKGRYGLKILNERILSRLKETKTVRYVPIILRKNAPSLDLYNGQSMVLELSAFGTIERRDDLYAFIKEGDGFRKVSSLILPEFELAFATSIHKSQGSEYKKVVLLLPPESLKFEASLLYTAVTRAKQSIRIFSDQETFLSLAQKKPSRKSSLKIPL